MNEIKKKKPTVHYVDNKKFFDAIVEYKRKQEEAAQAGLESPRIPEYIGSCILKIATNVARRRKFINYSFKDEMISDGIENCIKYFDNFNPNKFQNPFAYFSEICNWAFIRRIKGEKKNRYIIYKSFQTSISDKEHLQDDEGNNLISKQMYDNIDTFIVDFEESERIKIIKKKKKRKAALKKTNKLLEALEKDD